MGAAVAPPSDMPELYRNKHSGACLVVGYAPDVYSDVERARALRPQAPLLGVKYAACLYPEIEHVWTQHFEQAAHIKERAGRRIYVHARRRVNQTKRSFWFVGGTEDAIDYTWPDLKWVSGSSGIAAALWARHGMGYDEVILCGVPLEAGGYAAQVRAFKKLKGEKGASFVDNNALFHWRDSVREFIRQGKTAGILSMSGWTAKVMGAPC